MLPLRVAEKGGNGIDLLQKIAQGEKDLQVLASSGSGGAIDEHQLLQLFVTVQGHVQEFQKHPQSSSRPDSVQKLSAAILTLCSSWFRLAASGYYVPNDENGLRGSKAADIVCSVVDRLLAPEFDSSKNLVKSFNEFGGLGLFGSSLCHFDERILLAATRRLKRVALCCSAYANHDEKGRELLATNVEAFRIGFVTRLVEDLSRTAGRRLRVSHFKDLVADIGDVLSVVYSKKQVLVMRCFISLNLSGRLTAFCPGVGGEDAIMALDWLTSEIESLLQQSSTPSSDPTAHGPNEFSSSEAIREQVRESIAMNGLWSNLLLHAGCLTIEHAQKLLAMLLDKGIYSLSELVQVLQQAGAFPPSHISATSRLALQQALLTAVAAQGVQTSVQLFDDLSRVLAFDHLDQEGIDLLVRVTQQALSAGYRPAMEQARSLAFAHLLRYLQWGYGQSEIPKTQIDFAHRSLLQSLAPHQALVPFLPSLAAEALRLGASSASLREGRTNDVLRCVSALGNVAVDAARTGVAATFGAPEAGAHLAADAVARLSALLWQCTTDLHIVSAPAADVWLGAFIDTLSCYLRSPGAQLDSSQVNVLWTRLVLQPVFGLSVLVTASHYFKLAFLIQQPSRDILLTPFKEMPQKSPEIELVHSVIFCPASFASYGQEPPPLTSGFFFPLMSEARSSGGFVQMVVASEHPSPEKSQLQPSELTSNTLGNGEIDFVALAASVGISLPATSASTPALHLDQVKRALPPGGNPDLLMQLRGYEAVERYLLDEFEKQGQIKSTSKLRERDLIAERCRQLLQSQRDAANRVPSPPLDEAHGKFKQLCDYIKANVLVERTTRALHKLEEALAEAEDHFIQAQSTHARALVQQKRRGDIAPTALGAVDAARGSFEKIQIELVVELRLLAARAQLGLVELLSIPGLARALRVIGSKPCDPLFERLVTNEAWLQVQSQADTHLPEIPIPDHNSTSHIPGHPQGAKNVVMEDPSLARPDGLSSYAHVGHAVSLGGHVHVSRRNGVAVVLKALRGKSDIARQRELRALLELRQSCIVSLQGVLEEGGSPSHIELNWCGGGNLYEWCRKHPTIVGGADVEAYIKGLSIFRDLWQAVAYIHSKGASHGDLALHHVLLTCDHRPVLADFSRCCLLGDDVSSWSSDTSRPSDGYEAPEVAELAEAGARMAPTQEADTFAAGVMTMKVFLGINLDVSAYPADPRTGLRALPEESADADLLDFVQSVVAQSSKSRLSSALAAKHRALDPTLFLRRQGLLGATRKEGLAIAAEQLREEHRGRRVDELLMFNRDAVFDAVTRSKIFEWAEEALLGEWRVTLDSESGVDAGGLRREVITLFFEQLQQSSLVDRVGADAPGIQPTLFIADRLKCNQSPQQWRQTWSAVGAMVLRSIVHFGGAPVLFSSTVFDCAFGRIEKLPPDAGVNDDEVDGGVQALTRLRESRGDEWARSQLLDLLQRLRHADPQKDTSYRWMLAQRVVTGGQEAVASTSTTSFFLLSSENLETLSYMLGSLPYKFLIQSSQSEGDGSISHSGAVLEWTLLWDVYLKYVGDGDRWTAYEAFATGLSARGRRLELWTHMTGQRIADSLGGAKLTPDTVLANLEYKPGYGYDTQIGFFKNVLSHFTGAELSMFLRFATGIGRLPANGKFPNGQKLTVRFLPDQQERLPTAHTCFWTVDVPPYEDELDLETKLRQAIAAPQPFTFS